MPVQAELLSRIARVLAGVPDPEIPAVSIVDLGIVRDVGSDDGEGAWVALTPTYTGCPATAAIAQDTREALDRAGLADVAIRMVLSPAWSTDMITPEGQEKLRRYGIAPPEPGNRPARCPHCGSCDTREISRFGSTPCKALWQCRACHEPFDRFKCH
ncbi:phenylacetate-CoA oxygenase PaaJ subunit [Caenibius tardaugens NBRC 16725]|uniref:Phenylacetate-CoA oxygenase PaaJ subunit n=1 Tax=Caenibius tardaugens NBRC 16725 TaxID=1219035 RepID=U2YPF0_9SPHN|nr:1,2-phenylacetyl-CoA epoxidase subunit PaaD [Caenibius tardaugens]GAD50532.1 phenylacetate-CoA oxygenase PaaJ subunit [Caenibius tardaugens NBRC 16725]